MENKQAVSPTKKSLQQHTEGENKFPVFTDAALSTIEANKGTQISGLRKEKGRSYLVAVISLQINTALKMLPTHQTTPEAVAQVAGMIIDEFWAMKLEEILLAFKRGITGKYGKIYGQLSLNLFFDWIRAYLSEQSGETSELTEVREKEKHNKKIEGTKADAEVFATLVKSGKLKNPKERIGTPTSIKDILGEMNG